MRRFRNAPEVEVVYVASSPDDLDINAWITNYVRLVMEMDREQQTALTREAS